jgi:hypothetical protein
MARARGILQWNNSTKLYEGISRRHDESWTALFYLPLLIINNDQNFETIGINKRLPSDHPFYCQSSYM